MRLEVPVDKIGLVIGTGGKMINSLIKKFDLVSIDIDPAGILYVSGKDKEKVKEAIDEIKLLTREIKVGDIVSGTVVRNLDFGSIVDLGGGQDALLHISEIKSSYVKNISDVLKPGDVIRAKVIRIDENGRIGLSIKQLEYKQPKEN
jgi:polyribonucleotide nucleotidyltransferase